MTYKNVSIMCFLCMLAGCSAPTLKLVNHVGPVTYGDNFEYSSKDTGNSLTVVAFRSVHRFIPNTKADYQECADILNLVANKPIPVSWDNVNITAHEYNGISGISNTTCSYIFDK
ncbi:hypothetical protein [Photobacterium aquae]|uniref:hypothetical protein n=1 Tax=Photobacterium aquae TaxID=1195763 RepID=UPI0012ED418F|nr:hypothetical protein [Photobacterium aquae]